MTELPKTIAGIDKELNQQRLVLDALQVRSSRQIALKRIDELLDRRLRLQRRRSTDRVA